MIGAGILVMVFAVILFVVAVHLNNNVGCVPVVIAVGLFVFIGPAMILTGLMEANCTETYYGTCE